MKDAHNSR